MKFTGKYGEKYGKIFPLKCGNSAGVSITSTITNIGDFTYRFVRKMARKLFKNWLNIWYIGLLQNLYNSCNSGLQYTCQMRIPLKVSF